jgi:LysR family transcriptional regulator, glycine cleavage system transcriptional activator
MSDHLPPLSAIRVFEAAARHLSFTRAAVELGVTQAAVSYQIKVLEERVGGPLFLRRPRAVVLTEAGEQLAPRLRVAFEILREAFSDLSDQSEGQLTINAMHTFAANWLAPRLGAFSLAHPNIAVRLETTTRIVDFNREEVDVVVRAGKGVWPGLVATKLFDVRFTPMLSPQLAESIGGIKEPADIMRLPLIDHKDEWWIIWLKAHGLSLDVLDIQTSPSLNMQTLDAEEAMAGRGVALLMPEYFSRELAQGRLVMPFARLIDEDSGYWLAYPESRRNVPKIRTFRDWIVAEAASGRPPGSR